MVVKINKGKIVKISCLLTVAIMATSFVTLNYQPAQPVGALTLNEIQNQINSLEGQISAYEKQANELNKQANSLAVAVQQLEAERAAIQAKIDLSQAKYDQLTAQIQITQKKITNNREALAYVITDKYLNDSVTPIERLAGSDNLSKYLDEETKNSAVGDSLVTKVKEIKVLKQTLSDQQTAVEKVLDEQKGQREILVAKKDEQSKLLADTKGQESAYLNLRSQADSQRTALFAEQQRLINQATGGGSNSAGSVGDFSFRNYSGERGCGGGYPYCAGGLDYTIDQWSLYARECVSYTAWRLYYGYGKNVTSFMGQGNAYEWISAAPALMGATSNNTPEVGAAAIIPKKTGFPLGHAMVVEAILSDGWIRVSQYNFAVTGQYSTMEIPASAAVYIHFRNR
ncbi:CHAP domain-containing protein [Candidatus Saccharibacteria bacterium]|nr:CHAP domain-containing protein [Candidatus Saccharibacteria bacterium]